MPGVTPNPLPASPTPPVSSLVSLGMRMQLMTGCLRHIIIQHFSDPANIETPSLRGLQWTSDIATTGIIIETSGVWKPKQVGATPRVILKRGDWRTQRIGMNSLVQDNWLHGIKVFGKQINGGHRVSVTTASEDATEVLAYEVFAELTEFGPYLEQNLGLKRFEVTTVGSPQEIKTLDREEWSVDVLIEYAFDHTWEVAQEAPLLKTIDFQSLI